MGIKFRCPNGHKLHVKAFLAGKRGICPKCDSRFDIPLHSVPSTKSSRSPIPSAKNSLIKEVPRQAPNEKIEEQEPIAIQVIEEDTGNTGATAATAPIEIVTNTPGGAPAGPNSSGPFDENPNAIWYVRPSSGGQYGPAANDIMRQWLAEGRIAADSKVWREGWEEWQKASSVFTEFAPHGDSKIDMSSLLDEQEQPNIAEQHKSLRIQKSKRKNSITITLIAVVFLLAIVLMLVAMMQ